MKGKRKEPEKPKIGIYFFCSEDSKQMSLLIDSNVPLHVKQFITATALWCRNAEKNSEMIEEALEEDEAGDRDVH